MARYSFLSKVLFSFIFCFMIISCNHRERQVVPDETDTDELLKALQANDEETPDGLTFGADSIPGITLDFEMPTDDSEVYVILSQLTILDINPVITQDILDFIGDQMKENSFVDSTFYINPNAFIEKVRGGENYSEATMSVLDNFKKGFENLMQDSLPSYPFNLYFMIYPVYLDSEYVTYRQYSYSYTGGAHGMPYSYLRTYELKTGKLLTLPDIVKPEGLEDVREEVAAHMAYSYPIYENITTVEQYIDSLNMWLDNFTPEDSTGKITLKDYPLPNPAITSEGLVFIYQMYDLTPGSDGCPIVLIPFKDLKGCLTAPFTKFINFTPHKTLAE